MVNDSDDDEQTAATPGETPGAASNSLGEDSDASLDLEEDAMSVSSNIIEDKQDDNTVANDEAAAPPRPQRLATHAAVMTSWPHQPPSVRPGGQYMDESLAAFRARRARAHQQGRTQLGPDNQFRHSRQGCQRSNRSRSPQRNNRRRSRSRSRDRERQYHRSRPRSSSYSSRRSHSGGRDRRSRRYGRDRRSNTEHYGPQLTKRSS